LYAAIFELDAASVTHAEAPIAELVAAHRDHGRFGVSPPVNERGRWLSATPDGKMSQCRRRRIIERKGFGQGPVNVGPGRARTT